MSKEYYQIKTSYSSYYAEIWQQYPGVNKVSFGNKKKCVQFSVYKDDMSSEPPNIDALGYDTSCNLDLNLVRGIETQHMLKTAMEFIIQHYNLEHHAFLLKDTSKYPCSKLNIDLWSLYLVFHGKTWYEAKFNAKPISVPNYDQMKATLKSALKAKPPMDELTPLFTNKSLLSLFSEQYENHNSIIATLETLNKDYSCDVLYRWLSNLVSKYVPIGGVDWEIQHTQRMHIETIKLTNKPSSLFIMDGGFHEL